MSPTSQRRAFGWKLGSMIDEDNTFRKYKKWLFKSLIIRLMFANLLQIISHKMLSILNIRFNSPEFIKIKKYSSFLIMIPTYSIHHNHLKYYSNPDIFDPERYFLNDKLK